MIWMEDWMLMFWGMQNKIKLKQKYRLCWSIHCNDIELSFSKKLKVQVQFVKVIEDDICLNSTDAILSTFFMIAKLYPN